MFLATFACFSFFSRTFAGQARCYGDCDLPPHLYLQSAFSHASHFNLPYFSVEGSDPTYPESFLFEYEEGGGDDERRISIDVLNENGSWQCSRSFLVGEILAANGKCQVQAKNLSSGGVLIAHLSSAVPSGSLKLQLSGRGLKNMDGVGILRKSDPFFALLVLNDETGNWDGKYRSETIKNDLNPDWDECDIDLALLCGGKLDQRLRVVVFDEDDEKKINLLNLRPEQNEVMGYAESSVRKLLEGGEMDMLLRGKSHGHVKIGTAELVDYVDPMVNVNAILETTGRVEAAKLLAATTEEDLKKVEEHLATKKQALAEAQAAADEAQAAVQAAQEAAEAAKSTCDEVAGLFESLEL